MFMLFFVLILVSTCCSQHALHWYDQNLLIKCRLVLTVLASGCYYMHLAVYRCLYSIQQLYYLLIFLYFDGRLVAFLGVVKVVACLLL